MATRGDDGLLLKFVNDDETLAEFGRATEGRAVVLVFGAGWCGPCKLLQPHVERFSEQYQGCPMAKIDIDGVSDGAMGAFDVRAVPTYVMAEFKQGDWAVISRGQGNKPAMLEEMVSQAQTSNRVESEEVPDLQRMTSAEF